MSLDAHSDLIALLPRLRRFAHGLAGSPDEGDDLVQAACERALPHLAERPPGSRLDSWMLKIIQNLWIDKTRLRRRVADFGAENDLDQALGGDARSELEARLTLRKVEKLIGLLPDDQRRILLLATMDGIAYRDIAEILGIPIGTVMSRLGRARAALGRMLAEAPADNVVPMRRTEGTRT